MSPVPVLGPRRPQRQWRVVYRGALAGVQAVARGSEAMATDERGLTPRQAAFVREYLVDLNATQAAIRAGYAEASAGQQGEQLLKKLEIKAAVDEALAARAAKLEVTAEMVLAGLLKEATRETGPVSQGAKVRAWELLGKHLGMMTDRSKVEVTGDVSLLLTASLERFKRLAAESQVPPTE